MNKQIRLLSIVMLLLVSTAMVSAVESDDFDIVKVNLNEYDVASGSTFGPVYAGETLTLKVFWKGYNYTEARITAELADEEVESDYFTVRTNWTGFEVLHLTLDADLGPGDYILNIEMEDKEGRRNTYEVNVIVSDQRNLVEIYDVNFQQGINVQAGQILFASVGVKNIGHMLQEDLYVKMTIPALGLTTRSNRFDLYDEEWVEECNADYCEDDDYKTHKDLFLTIPLNAVSGTYDVLIEVVYEDGDSLESETYSLMVSGAQYDGEITIDTLTQTSEQGKAVAFWVEYLNPNVDYTIEIEGMDFGSVRIAEEYNGAYVFISVDEDAEVGAHDFVAIVKSGSNVVKTFNLNIDVVKSKVLIDIKKGLELGFSVLLVILVILGIIVAAKKLRRDREEPIIDEDQTYY